jgi:hypothetical protein
MACCGCTGGSRLAEAGQGGAAGGSQQAGRQAGPEPGWSGQATAPGHSAPVGVMQTEHGMLHRGAWPTVL